MPLKTIAVALGLDVAPYVAGGEKAMATNRAVAESAVAAAAQIDAAYAVAAKGARAYVVAATEASVANQRLAASGAEVVAADEAQIAASSRLTAALERQIVAGNGAAGAMKAGATSLRSMVADMSGAEKAAGLVGVAVVALGVEGVKQILSVDGEIRKLKGTLGSTAEEASGLRNVSVALGLDTDTVNTAIFRLSTNLQKTKGDLAGTHVETAKNSDGNANLYKTLLNLRAAYQSIGDAQERNIFLREAIGRGGAELRPLITASDEEYKRLTGSGIQRTEADLKASRDLSIALKEAGQSVKELEIDLANGLVPVLTTTAKAITTVVNAADKLSGPIGGIKGVIGAALDFTPLNLFKDHVSTSKLGLDGWAGTVENITSRVFPPLGVALDLAGRKTKDHTAATADSAAAQKNLAAQLELTAKQEEKAATAQAQLVDAHISGLDKVKAETTAEEHLADVVARAGEVSVNVDEESAKAREDYASKVTAADDRVSAARTNLAAVQVSAAARVSEAETHLADAQEAASRRVVDAQRSAADANENAHRSTRSAEQALSDLRANQAATGNPVLAAMLQRAQAMQRAVEAVDRARDAEKDTAVRGSESVGRAQTEGAKQVDSAADALAKARTEGAKQVQVAEAEITKARAEQVKVAGESEALDRRLVALARERETAVKEVGKAQGAVAMAQRTDAIAEAKEQAAAIELGLQIKGRDLTQMERNLVLAQQYDLQAAKFGPGSPMRKNLEDLSDRLKGLKVDIDTGPAEKMLFGLTEKASALKKVWDDLNTTTAGRAAVGAGALPPGSRPEAGVASAASGAVFHYFAQGGTENHIAQIAPAGVVRVWAEPETGGEAYIPLSAAKRPGSEAVLATVARQFDMAVVKMDKANIGSSYIAPPQPILGSGIGSGGGGIDYDKLGAAIARAQGVRQVGPFNITGVPSGDVASAIPREIRREMFLMGGR